MTRKTFWFVAVVLSAAMLGLNLGYAHAQTVGQIPMFGQPATGACNAGSSNDCLDSVISQDATGVITIGGNLNVVTNTTGDGGHTANFAAPNIGPNASHIHFGPMGDWYIRSASGAPASRVILQDTGGNVGIGTQFPIAGKLTVSGDTGAIAVYGAGGGANGIGVNGVANAVTGIGVSGVSSSGTGVVGYSDSGRAMYVDGNAGQARDKGGWVKTMLFVNSNGTIARCYNGITNSSGGNCGFSVTHNGTGGYIIDFGFQVNDRFYSATPGWDGGRTGVNFLFPPNCSAKQTANQVCVTTFYTKSGNLTNAPFSLIVY